MLNTTVVCANTFDLVLHNLWMPSIGAQTGKVLLYKVELDEQEIRNAPNRLR